MSVNIVNQTTGDLARVAGNATDKVGNLDALTTTSKTDAVSAINEVNNFAKSMLAPSTLLTSSDDLNSILTAGVYRTEGTSVPAHAIGNNHIIWVIKQGATNYTRYLQVMYVFNTKEMYFRQTTDAGSTWSNWTLISSEDTGWMQIGTSGIYYRKSGNVVAIRGETLPNTTSWTLLATLPQGYRPVDTFMRALRAVPQDDKLSSLYVASTGEIYAESDVATKFQEIFFI